MKITAMLQNGVITQLDDALLVPGIRIPVQLLPDGEITACDIEYLVRADGGIDNEVERTSWIEFRLKSDPDADRAVHRSVDMYLKQGVFGSGVAASFG